MGLTCSLLIVFCSLTGRAATSELPPNEDLIGWMSWLEVSEGDTLVSMARRADLGYDEMVSANPGLDIWLPQRGRRALLPTLHVLPSGPREGLVINLAEKRLYYFPADRSGQVTTYPIGIGREGWQTPLAQTRIQSMQRDPSWYPPASIRQEAEASGRWLPKVVPPGPDNPLGAYAIRLALPGYLLHGTNRPPGVGMRVSHGCIRLYPEDVEALFESVKPGLPVRIVDEPFKAGWRGDELWLEVSPPTYPVTERAVGRSLILTLIAATPQQDVELDWDQIRAVIRRADGVPTVIGVRRSGTRQ